MGQGYLCLSRVPPCSPPLSAVDRDRILHLQHSPARLGLISVQSWGMKTNNEHVKTPATHTERGFLPAPGRSSSVSPEMFIALERDQESLTLSSSLFPTPCPCLTISFSTSAQREDPALPQLHIPLCLCPQERPFYLIPQLLSASKNVPSDRKSCPMPKCFKSPLQYWGIPKRAGSPSTRTAVPSSEQPWGSQATWP